MRARRGSAGDDTRRLRGEGHVAPRVQRKYTLYAHVLPKVAVDHLYARLIIRDYDRSASIGSTRVARCAGRNVASSADAPRRTGATVNVTASTVLI